MAVEYRDYRIQNTCHVVGVLLTCPPTRVRWRAYCPPARQYTACRPTRQHTYCTLYGRESMAVEYREYRTRCQVAGGGRAHCLPARQFGYHPTYRSIDVLRSTAIRRDTSWILLSGAKGQYQYWVATDQVAVCYT